MRLGGHALQHMFCGTAGWLEKTYPRNLGITPWIVPFLSDFIYVVSNCTSSAQPALGAGCLHVLRYRA